MTLRILYLPHGRRRAYFEKVFTHGVNQRRWKVGVLAPASARKSYPFVTKESDFIELWSFLDDAAAGIGATSDTASIIAAAERAAGIPAARLILASERDIGRGFSLPFFHIPTRREIPAVLADNMLPSRVVAAIFARMAKLLADFRPDIIITGNVAAPHHLATAMLARLHGVRFLIGRPSKVHANRSFWTTDLQMLNKVAAESEILTADGTHADDVGPAYIAAFRDRPRTIAYIERTWRDGASQTWFRQHRYFAELLYLQLKHGLLRRRGASPKQFWPSLLEYYQTEWFAARQRRFFLRPTSGELAMTKFVYLALHKEPELAINYQACAWHNQYETAAKIAAALPHGVRLVVREHRFNRGRRPPRFYRDLAALPNTIIVDPYDDQFKYISNAAVIVTDNGSTGWEGLLLGRRVVTLDRTFYDAAELTHPVYEPARLGEKLVQLLNEPMASIANADARLANFIAAEFATTIPDNDDGVAANIAAIESFALAGYSKQSRAS